MYPCIPYEKFSRCLDRAHPRLRALRSDRSLRVPSERASQIAPSRGAAWVSQRRCQEESLLSSPRLVFGSVPCSQAKRSAGIDNRASNRQKCMFRPGSSLARRALRSPNFQTATCCHNQRKSGTAHVGRVKVTKPSRSTRRRLQQLRSLQHEQEQARRQS